MRNENGFYDWKGSLTMKEPKPERVIVHKYPEDWCRHPNAEKLYQEVSEGESLKWFDGKRRFVTRTWQYIRCDCRTEKVLMK